LSIIVTHEQKWVNTLPNGKQKRQKKKKGDYNKEQIKGKNRTIERLKNELGLKFWKKRSFQL